MNTTHLNELLSRYSQAQEQLVLQTSDLPLGTLAEMVEQGSIDLAPGFQRRERWSRDKQSALIESFLLNVPVPPIYLSEEPEGTYVAIDGKQRLKAISDFMHDRLPLSNLERLTSAEGLRFSEMPPAIGNAIRLRPFLRIVTLLRQTNDNLKYEVFLRLNKGGESLNPQEIRNVAFRGPMNEEIYRLADHPFLRQQLKILSHTSQAYRQMADAEYVLRFLTLRESLPRLSGAFGREMDLFMSRHQFDSETSVDSQSSAFLLAIRRCEELWGDLAFRRPDGDGWRDQTLAGMYDAQMLSCVVIDEQTFIRARDQRTAYCCHSATV